jgi:hypothetical protein
LDDFRWNVAHETRALRKSSVAFSETLATGISSIGQRIRGEDEQTLKVVRFLIVFAVVELMIVCGYWIKHSKPKRR